MTADKLFDTLTGSFHDGVLIDALCCGKTLFAYFLEIRQILRTRKNRTQNILLFALTV